MAKEWRRAGCVDPLESALTKKGSHTRKCSFGKTSCRGEEESSALSRGLASQVPLRLGGLSTQTSKHDAQRRLAWNSAYR